LRIATEEDRRRDEPQRHKRRRARPDQADLKVGLYELPTTNSGQADLKVSLYELPTANSGQAA
jgi:hypothetical protein